jgi:hypothetical protein
VGKALNITIAIDFASRESAQIKAMPLTEVNDIAFAYLGAGTERSEIN